MPPRQQHVVDREGQRHESRRGCRAIPRHEHPHDQRQPRDRQDVRQRGPSSRVARVQVTRGHERENGEHQDQRQRHGGRPPHDVDVERHDVPIGRKPDEEMIVGLRIDLAEAVGTGDERHEQPGAAEGLDQSGSPDQQERQARVRLEIDQVIQPTTVEPGQHLAHARAAGQPARRSHR